MTSHEQAAQPETPGLPNKRSCPSALSRCPLWTSSSSFATPGPGSRFPRPSGCRRGSGLEQIDRQLDPISDHLTGRLCRPKSPRSGRSTLASSMRSASGACWAEYLLRKRRTTGRDRRLVAWSGLLLPPRQAPSGRLPRRRSRRRSSRSVRPSARCSSSRSRSARWLAAALERDGHRGLSPPRAGVG